ncbi:MAG TPA: PA14 domain-containing protein, partial [Povalibacter sp.]
GARVFVSRFITPPLPGESTANVGFSRNGISVGGEVRVLSAATLATTRTIVLNNSTKADFENQGSGIPNYLGALAISPDGTQAWVPSKQDNVQRGTLRSGSNLNFQNTVRAISSRIDLATQSEDAGARIDHDDSSVASAAIFDRRGVYLFVALETSREVAVVDAHGGWEIFRIDTGRAPQGLALSADGSKLLVSNFTDRSLSVFDLSDLFSVGDTTAPLVDVLRAIQTEKLAANVLRGKQLFYDARDPRLARDSYMSCASCHNDGGQDGRVWDLTGMGEGLRNTIALRGRKASHGFLHWSNNFDEVQDFEGQIRTLAGGTGLMSDTDFHAGTRSTPLGTPKAGISADLDALAAYLVSLNKFDDSPLRTVSGGLTSQAVLGTAVFKSTGCATCHSGVRFTASGSNTLIDIGTVSAASGYRLGGDLTGIDVPTLRDVWATAPYLHNGSAATIPEAIRAHQGVTLSDTDLANLAAYVAQIGAQETVGGRPPGSGTGLKGEYFNNTTLSGEPVVTATQAIDFDWGSGSPAAGINVDLFSARWTGFVEAPSTGTYRFQTAATDGVRLWVNGIRLTSDWGVHDLRSQTGPPINLVAGQRYAIKMEYFDNTGKAVVRLRWTSPGNELPAAISATWLHAQ